MNYSIFSVFAETPPAIFKNTNPIPTPIHLVKILIKITTVKESEISTPCKEKNPANVLSVTPIPIGNNDATPKSIELVYVAIMVVNSKILTSNPNNTKYTIVASMIQNIEDRIVDIIRNFPLNDFFNILYDVSNDNSYFEIILKFATFKNILLKTLLELIIAKMNITPTAAILIM